MCQLWAAAVLAVCAGLPVLRLEKGSPIHAAWTTGDRHHFPAAHKAAASGETAEVKKLEEKIDRAPAKLWALSDDNLAEIKRSLEEA